MSPEVASNRLRGWLLSEKGETSLSLRRRDATSRFTHFDDGFAGHVRSPALVIAFAK